MGLSESTQNELPVASTSCSAGSPTAESFSSRQANAVGAAVQRAPGRIDCPRSQTSWFSLGGS